MSNPTLLRSETTSSASKSGASSPTPHGPDHPEHPYQTGKGCLIMIGVFGGLVALAVGAMLVTGMLSDK